MEPSTSIEFSAPPKSFKEEVQLTMNLGWPIILSNLTQILLPIIDGIMVGSIHSNQLAAASLVINIATIPVILCMALPMALSPLVSSALGKSDFRSPLKLLVNGMIVGGLFALVLALLFYFGSEVVYQLGQDEEVALLAEEYLVIIGWRLIPVALFVALTNFSEGLGKTKMVMIINLIALPINVFLNYLLIFGNWGLPALGLNGAGYGTLLTQVIILIAFIYYVATSKSFADHRQELHSAFKVDYAMVKDIFRIGIPSGIQFSLENGAFAFSGVMAGWLGAQQQAAHQIGLYISSLTFMISMGICTAGTIRVAFYFGKNDWTLVKSIGRSTLIIAGVIGAVFSLLLLLGFNYLPYLFVSESAVIEFAKMVLLMAAIFQLTDALQATSAGILRGIQDVKVPAYLGLVAYWLIGIPFGYVFAFQMDWGVSGLWAGLIAGLSANAVLLTNRFFRLVKSESKNVVDTFI
ncbi:MATE family efflux transporter [Algoriphagus boritolerans]|uniref:Multidrug-efflux transporter n=1 Tax=Algoriphagus boritolerans DSM 17298 = JCM 18970 TaxID=1120964 RepID=A0A1H6ANI2_9BACT|nr:MATE family efflux transporter [Algoriphagus boritolerans]SEG49627.1 multidrug resistance protein, MATE family [Algoriphagus boritolerans DSM 17298 = JCM 18970]